MPAGNCISVCFKDTIKASCGDPSLWGIVLLVYVCVCVHACILNEQFQLMKLSSYTI